MIPLPMDVNWQRMGAALKRGENVSFCSARRTAML
jgi:hypothetical protein